MQPSPWKQIRRIAGKETTLFFTSPIAYLFLAAFVSISFFAVFWGEAVSYTHLTLPTKA